jgi:hypothetical protein
VCSSDLDGGGMFGPSNSTIVSRYPQGTFGQTNCVSIVATPYLPNICSYHQGSGKTITTTLGLLNGVQTLQLTFSEFIDLQEYYGSYLSQLPFSGTPYDNTNIDYYRYYIVQISTVTGDTLCSDVGGTINVNVHTSTQVTTGQTGSNYYMNVTLPTISRNISFQSCQASCDSIINSALREVNYFSSITFSYTSNVGARFENPFVTRLYVRYDTSPSTPLYMSNYFGVVRYSYRTFVYTGTGNYNTYTFIPQLSANTSWYYLFEIGNTNNLAYLTTSSYFFRPEVSDFRNFTISGYTISNFDIAQLEKAYEYSGGTVIYSNPNFII